MTHFVRYAMIGALVAGTSVCAIAQDDDLEALLGDLVDDSALVAEEDAEPAAEEIAEPDAEPAAEEVAEDIADEPAAEESVDEVAEPEAETPAEEVAEEATEPEAEEPAEDVADPEAEIPAEEPAAEEVAEKEVVAETTEPEVEPVAEDDAPEAEPTEEDVAEEVEATEEPAEETGAIDEPAETPAEEIVDEADVDAPAEEADEVVAEEIDTPAEAEEVVEEVAEEPAEETVDEEPTEEPAPAPAEEVEDEPAPAAVDDPAPSGEGLLGGLDADDTELKAQTEEERKYNELALLMELKNRGLDNHGLACLNKARTLMTTDPKPGKAFDTYADAIKLYTDAQEFLRTREENLPLRDECDKGILEAKYRQAKVRFEEGDYKNALEMAQAVQLNGHPRGEALVAIIQEEMNRPEKVEVKPTLPEYAKGDYRRGRLSYQDRMRRATVYFQLAKYKEANDQLELILRDDPNNEEAINLRTRIERRHSERNRQLKRSTHTEMITQVHENWTPLGALGRNSEELYTPTESKGATTKVNKDGEKAAAVIMAKLQYIRLPEFSIRPPSTLADVVSLFNELSVAYDKPELPMDERGVGFVLNIGKAAAPAASSDEEEDPFASESASASGLPPISAISMNWVTLKEALDMVCDVTGSKYIIKGKTVMIVPSSYVAGEMVTRSYNVMAGLMEKLGAVNDEMGESGGESEWGSDESSGSSSSADSNTLKRVFSELGVPFEGNAKIAYLPTIGKLRVTNSAENLALLEGILEDLNVTPSQIEVEARFVEVSQEDLNSLGFEWRLNSDIVGTVGSGIDWADSVISSNVNRGMGAGGTGANGHVFRPQNGGTGDANVALHGGKLNNGMRFLGDDAAYANRINLANSTVAPDDTFASFSAVFGRVDMTMILHMLAQRSDTDMLSSPKVLARPGQEALIRVVTEHIYPTEFDITELEEAEQNWNGSNSNNNSLTGGNNMQMNAPPVKFAVEPQSFEKMDVGVSLQVVPELSQEGQMINMLINPKVVEYLGDFDYGMKVPYIQYGMTAGMVTSAEVQYYNVEMPQPKFHIREINTYISVYNGSTVVMGGLITETRKSFEDKVPFLGDLPFIGFLFRSKGEFSEKRNLLVFLTARLVDPAGRPLKTATDGRMGDATMDNATAETMSDTVAE